MAGHPPPKMSEEGGASWDRVSANYLQNFGVPLLRGRASREADNETTAPVAIVNEAFVKRFFKSDEDPLDQYFGLDLPENVNTFRIVGIVRDAKFAGWGLDRPARPMFYVPLAQNVDYQNATDAADRAAVALHRRPDARDRSSRQGRSNRCSRRRWRKSIRNLTITSVRTMQQQVELSFDQERAVATLAGLFGIVALLLAAVGALRRDRVHGRAAHERDRHPHGARRRPGERGRPGTARRLQHAWPLGLVAWRAVGVGAGRLIAAQLYGVSFWDPLALVIAAGSLAICAFFAAVIPARRAASISPMEALRTE